MFCDCPDKKFGDPKVNTKMKGFKWLKIFFWKSAKILYYISISCQKLYYSNTLSLESAKIEILRWELTKAWRLKLRSLEMITRWHCFSYEKQCHLHASEKLLKEDRHGWSRLSDFKASFACTSDSSFQDQRCMPELDSLLLRDVLRLQDVIGQTASSQNDN